MRDIKRVLLFSLMMLFVATGANAVTVFKANLTGSQEVPPNASIATGTASFVLNDAQTALIFTATIFGIDFGALPQFNTPQTPGNTADNLLNAHIHCCALPGTNASVVWGFIGAPFNDNNPNDVVVTPFTAGQNGGVGGFVSGKWDAPEGNNTTLAAQLAGILADQAYINFHTVGFTGGEIRGQIVHAPEPSAVFLLGMGLSAIGLIFRSRP